MVDIVEHIKSNIEDRVDSLDNNDEFQKIVKELNLEDKKLTAYDLRSIFRYMQEMYCL